MCFCTWKAEKRAPATRGKVRNSGFNAAIYARPANYNPKLTFVLDCVGICWTTGLCTYQHGVTSSKEQSQSFSMPTEGGRRPALPFEKESNCSRTEAWNFIWLVGKFQLSIGGGFVLFFLLIVTFHSLGPRLHSCSLNICCINGWKFTKSSYI